MNGCFAFAEVRLNIHGASRVSWDEQRAYTKGSASIISHKNSEVFLDHTINLLKKRKSIIISIYTVDEDFKMAVMKLYHVFPF